MLLLACAGAEKKMPFHGPLGKASTSWIMSLRMKGLSLQDYKKGMLFVERPFK